jgi:DNA-directed RNA polymerase delta subunit
MSDEVINMVKNIELSEITNTIIMRITMTTKIWPHYHDVSLDVDSAISTKELGDLIQDDSSKQDDISTTDHDTIQEDNDNVPIQIGFDSEPFPESVSYNKTSEDENEDAIEEKSDNINEATVDEDIQTKEIANEEVSPRT